MEELNELKNLVIQSLENNGALSNIRAQIRSSVFKVIDAQESNNPKKVQLLPYIQVSQFHWENLKVQKLAENKDGQECLMLIKEVLQFYQMDYTLNIFTPESNVKEEIKRDDVVNKVGLKGKAPEDKPVLFHMFQQFMKNTGVKPSKVDGKDAKKGSNKDEPKPPAAASGSLASEKEAISKAEEVIKKNVRSEAIGKIPDLPVQKKAAPPREEEEVSFVNDLA